MKKMNNESDGRRTTAVLPLSSGKWIIAKRRVFELLGRNDYARKRDAIRSLLCLHQYGEFREELDRIDSRIAYLNAEIRRLRMLHHSEGDWMNIKREAGIMRMDCDSAAQSRKYFLELCGKKADAIRGIGIITVMKTDEYRLFKKVRDEEGLDGVRVAVLCRDDRRKAEEKLRKYEIL